MTESCLLVAGTLGILVAAGIRKPEAGSRNTDHSATVEDLYDAFEADVGSGNGSRNKNKDRSPAEIFLRTTPQDVPDHLLLAVILSGTTKGNAIEVASKLVADVHGDLERLTWLGETTGLGPASKARLRALGELIRRMNYRKQADVEHVMGPDAAARLIRAMATGPHEQLVAIYLDSRSRVLASRRLTMGSAGFTIVDPRQVFRPAVDLGATSVILGHQHPSMDTTPSHQDIEVTQRVRRAGDIIGIKLLDHLVVSRTGAWTSLAEEGYV